MTCIETIARLIAHRKLEDFGLPPIDWAAFGRECERLCKLHGRNYYLKEGLRAEMERVGGNRL